MQTETIINKMLKYIEERIEDSFTVKELADVAGYSECHFIRIFKDYMDVTVMEYINKRKLIKASEDIISGEKVIDVAMKYGWQSHSGFTKAFKRVFGFHPSLLKMMLFEINSLGGSGMNHVFLDATKVGAKKEELFTILQEKIKVNGVDIEQNKLIKMYQRACEAYNGITRYSGEEYVTHPLNVSIILAELGAGADIILAGMFCDVERKGKVLLEDLKDKLPLEVYDIVSKLQIENGKLEIEEDEVQLIKLAERLHNMRTIEFINESKRQEKAEETLEIFMPLARKLNNKKLIDELNDLSMKY